MIAIIRIRGRVNLDEKTNETLNRLNLRKKYTCVVFEKLSSVQEGMLKKVENLVAYGELSKELYEELKTKRKNTLKENVFRLSPPVKGLKSSKLHYPKGVLGNNKEAINDLIRRMI
jgi:ribosomal protein L30/L7E